MDAVENGVRWVNFHQKGEFMKNRLSRILVITMMLAFMGIASQVSAADLPGKGITVQPLKSSIAEETFQTLLVLRAL